MKDGIMYTWEVVGDYDNGIEHICASLNTAEYLRDWCQAIEWDRYVDVALKDGYQYDEHFGHAMTFSIQEGEVIL